MSGQGDIRKWFSRGRAAASEHTKEESPLKPSSVVETAGIPQGGSVKPLLQACSTESKKKPPVTVKAEAGMKSKRSRAVIKDDDDDDDDELFVPGKAPKNDDEDEEDFAPRNAKKARAAAKDQTPRKAKGVEVERRTEEDGGRGGGRTPGGRGGGRGGRGAFFMQPTAPPPHKGEKEIPEGAEDALSGLTFVITGTLDSIEREEAEDLIKRHGGRVTGSVSSKTTYLLTEEENSETSKARKAREIGVKQLNEDGLFNLIKKSSTGKTKATTPAATTKAPAGAGSTGQSQSSLQEESVKPTPSGTIHRNGASTAPGTKSEAKARPSVTGRAEGLSSKHAIAPHRPGQVDIEAWPQKYAPKSMADIIGNQSLVKELQEWLRCWHDAYGGVGQGSTKKGKGVNVKGLDKKAVLLSGPPGIGKTTSARLVAAALGFTAVEVNASDSRGKSDSKVRNGIGGSKANAIKEMVSNTSLNFLHAGDGNSKGSKSKGKQPSGARKEQQERAVLIMDEVDGMSGGDRGGVADLILSIKSSGIPIICICNDRYSQKLRSLVNYCFCLNYRKPTKQQMAKRLKYIADQEGLTIPENALLELGERVNGDMRMALNQLQYMSLNASSLSYMDVKGRLQSSAKDEDIRPMAACDLLMGYQASSLKLDRLMDAAMSDIDLMPLMVQENYLNHVPSATASDQQGDQLMRRASAAADSISLGDLVNVQVRRYQQWQHLPFNAFMACITPGFIMCGRRVTFEQGEMNFDRFPGWLGKNSTMGKNSRLLDEVRSHMVSSKAAATPSWQTVRMDYVETLERRILLPMKMLDPDDGVEMAADLMESYALAPEDLETTVSVSRFKGRPDVGSGIPAPVKAKLTRELKKRMGDSKAKSSAMLPALALKGKGKSVPAAFRHKKAGKKRAGSSGAWLDTSAIQADPDMPVAQEEGAGAQGEDGEDVEDEANGEDEDQDEDASTRQRLLGNQDDDDETRPKKGRASSSKGTSRGGRGRGARGRGRGKRGQED